MTDRPAGGAGEKGCALLGSRGRTPAIFSGAIALMGIGGWLFLFAAVLLLRHLW